MRGSCEGGVTKLPGIVESARARATGCANVRRPHAIKRMSELPKPSRGSVRAVALLLVALGLWVWWSWAGDEMPPPIVEEVASGEPMPTAPLVVGADIERQATFEYSEPEPIDFGDEPADAELDHPHAFSLQVHVRGPFGLPVDDAQVFVAPELAGFSLWPEDTHAGRVQVRWRGRERVMQMQVAVMAWGVLQPMRSITVEADVVAHIAFQATGKQQSLASLTRLAEVSERELQRDYREVMRAQRQRRQRLDHLDMTCGRTMVMFKFYRCIECHEETEVAAYAPIARSGTMVPGLHPGSRFEDLREHGLRGKQLEDRKKALRDQLERRGLDDLKGREGQVAQLTGRVVAKDGQVAAGVPVAWIGEEGAVLRATTTDSRGRYELGPVPGGNLRLVAGGGPLGAVDALVQVAPTGTTVWNFDLLTDRFVAGRVLDEGGDPLRNWRVELVRDISGWAMLTHTDKDGGFAAYGVPGPVQCLVWPQEKTSAFPVIFGLEALVDASMLQLRLRSDHPIRGRLRARASLPPGYEQARIDARVTQLETGRVAQMDAFGFRNEFVAEPLAPGKYRVQFGAPGFGWAVREEFVDGRGLWDLGDLYLPAAGKVRLQRLPGAPDVLADAHAFYRRTPAVDVRVEYDLQDGVVVLPPGRHVLVWRTTGEVRAREFEVISGAVIDVPIWPAAGEHR